MQNTSVFEQTLPYDNHKHYVPIHYLIMGCNNYTSLTHPNIDSSRFSMILVQYKYEAITFASLFGQYATEFGIRAI